MESGRLIYLSGLPFGRPGDTVRTVISEGCLQVKSDPRLRNSHTMQTLAWSYRIETNDIRGLAVAAPGRGDARGGLRRLFPFSLGVKSLSTSSEPILTIRAAIYPERVQAIQLTGPKRAIESLAAEVEEECRVSCERPLANGHKGWYD